MEQGVVMPQVGDIWGFKGYQETVLLLLRETSPSRESLAHGHFVQFDAFSLTHGNIQQAGFYLDKMYFWERLA